MTDDVDCPNCGHSSIVYHAGPKTPGGQMPPCFMSVDAETGETVSHIFETVVNEDGSLEQYLSKPPDPSKWDGIEFCPCAGTLKDNDEWMDDEEVEEFWNQ